MSAVKRKLNAKTSFNGTFMYTLSLETFTAFAFDVKITVKRSPIPNSSPTLSPSSDSSSSANAVL